MFADHANKSNSVSSKKVRVMSDINETRAILDLLCNLPCQARRLVHVCLSFARESWRFELSFPRFEHQCHLRLKCMAWTRTDSGPAHCEMNVKRTLTGDHLRHEQARRRTV